MLIKSCIHVNKKPEIVCRLFWDMNAWCKIWAPIQNIQLIYHDPIHQEVVMTVDRDGKSESNRTIRFLKTFEEISFFSVEPPPLMEYHRGIWKFLIENDGCRIIAERDYVLAKYSNEVLQDFKERSKLFFDQFSLRINKILEKFQQHFMRQHNYV